MRKHHGQEVKIGNGGKRRQTNRVNVERYKLCPNCGNFYSEMEDVDYCGVCGEKLIDHCPRCHEPILYPTSKFCPLCGERYGKDNN